MSDNDDSTLSPLKYLDLKKLEQFAASVLNYSSKYNSPTSIAYAPENLIGKNVIYPNYGDYPDTYYLRSYGKWWNESETAQKHYRSQDIDPVVSEDFIILRFENAVIPSNIIIYETYNPGAVVKIWGRLTGERWNLLYSGPLHRCKAESRRFAPKLRIHYNLINEVRLEFNQSHLDYHTSIDAVLLIGYLPKTNLQAQLVRSGFFFNVSNENNKHEDIDDISSLEEELFSKLPYEVMVQIFEYLDLKSLCCCAQVCKRWYQVTLDPALYRDLSLKEYWHKVDDGVIKFFMKRCSNLRKLDLSWCSNDFVKDEILARFLEIHGEQLTHLSLCNCEAVDVNCMKIISNFQNITDLRLRNVRVGSVSCLKNSQCRKLITLDLFGTAICDADVIHFLKNNPNLKHLILDLCSSINNLDSIAETASIYNKELVSWSSWKTNPLNSMSSDGIKYLAKCKNLRELDVGWCLLISDPADCLEKIAFGCKDLRRLVLSQWRSVSDQQIKPVLLSCKKLIQLDLMGLMNITSETCELALINLPNLQQMDIAYCSVHPGQVAFWREQYSHVKIHFNTLSI